MSTSRRTNQLLNTIFYILGVLLFVGFFVVTVWGEDGLLHLMELRQTRDKIVKANHELTYSNFLLLEEIQRLKQGQYVEQKARSDMGMVKENEIVFVIR